MVGWGSGGAFQTCSGAPIFYPVPSFKSCPILQAFKLEIYNNNSKIHGIEGVTGLDLRKSGDQIGCSQGIQWKYSKFR